MTKREDGFIDFGGLDPVVEGAISQGHTRGRRTPGARSAATSHARKAARDAERNRRMIDLPEDLEARLVAIADELSVPVSSLIVFLTWRGLAECSIEEIRAARVPSRSMKFEYVLRGGLEGGEKRRGRR